METDAIDPETIKAGFTMVYALGHWLCFGLFCLLGWQR